MREDKTLTGRFFPRAQLSIESIRKEIEGRTLLREKISTSVELPLAPETKKVLHTPTKRAIACNTDTSARSICYWALARRALDGG